MIKITIPCFFEDEETETNEIIGKEMAYADGTIKNVRFYNINAVSPYVDKVDGKIYACVHSNGTEFVSSLSVKDVIKIIEDAFI